MKHAMQNFSYQLLLTTFLIFLFLSSVHAQTEWDSFTLVVDNDIFAPNNLDRHYTNGIHLRFESSEFEQFTEENTPGFLLPILSSFDIFQSPTSGYSIAYQIGQAMYTPEDTSVYEPQPDDEPYAGLIYGSVDFKVKKRSYSDTFTVLAGVVGPLSLAEETQKFVHKHIVGDPLNGWQYQLKNEPVLNIMYERRWPVYGGRIGSLINYEVLGIANGKLGTMLTEAAAGGALIFAHNKATHDKLASASHPGSFYFFRNDIPNGLYAYVGGVGRLTLRNIFLDGNTFRESYSVERRPLHQALFYGLGYAAKKWMVSVAWFKESRRFKTQREGMFYGSLMFSYRY